MNLPSTWSDVDTLSERIDKETKQLISQKLDNTKYEIIRVRKRMIGQLDYWYKPMYTTDIVVKYNNDYYIIFTNVVCIAGVNSKYYRLIEQVNPGYIKLVNKDIDIADTLVKYIKKNSKDPHDYRGHFENISDNKPDCYGCDDMMDYYDDPKPENILLTDGTFAPVTYFNEKYNSWHETCYNKDEYDIWYQYTYKFPNIPDDQFELLCFALTVYQYTHIYSGK